MSSRTDKEVLIVGVLDNPASTNVHMAKGFEQLGCKVTGYNYRTEAKRLGGVQVMWDHFLSSLKGKKYDLILFSKTDSLHPECIKQAGSFGPTWYWFMDGLHVAERMNAQELAASSDFASATSSDVVGLFAPKNTSSHHILEGYSPDIYSTAGSTIQTIDAAFIGSPTPKRVQQLDFLSQRFPVKIFGQSWPESFSPLPAVYNENLAKTMAATRILLNFVHGNIFSDRVVLSMAAGGFVLSEYCPDLPLFFEKEKHLDWFQDKEEALDKIHYYLKHEEKRKQIARAGKELVEHRFTWKAVCERVLNVLEQKEMNRAGSPAVPPINYVNHKKILCVSWHGLGDNIMLIPALRKLKQKYPHLSIHLAGMERFGKRITELLSGIEYIDSVYEILPDAWNDFDSYDLGVKKVLQAAGKFAQENQFDLVLPLFTHPMPGFRRHKIFRFAREMCIDFDCFEDLETELCVQPQARKRVDEFIEQDNRPYVVLHTKGGNKAKSLPGNMTAEILKRFSEYRIYEFGQKSIPRSVEVEEADMEFSKALVAGAAHVVAIDSVVMHMAGALKRPCTAVFTMTPVHQALPITFPVEITGLDNPVTAITKWPEYKEEIMNHYPGKTTRKNIKLKNADSPADVKSNQERQRAGRLLITGPGHGGTNWVTEIARGSEKFAFTSQVEDRELFHHPELPPSYATKLATDNAGMYPENIVRLLETYPDMYVLFAMRHPVDLALSKIYRALKASEENPMYRDPWMHAWDGTRLGAIKSIELAYSVYHRIRTVYPERIQCIHLEDLIQDTEQSIETIADFLGVPVSPKMKRAHGKVRNNHQQKRYGGKIDEGQIALFSKWDRIYGGFYKNKQECVGFLLRELAPLAESFGYKSVERDFKSWRKKHQPIIQLAGMEQQNTHCRAKEKKYQKAVGSGFSEIKEQKNFSLPQSFYERNAYWSVFLTLRCTSSCPYCIQQMDPKGFNNALKEYKELPGEAWITFLNELPHPKGQKLALIGGEPTIHQDFLEIINNLEEYFLTVTTNLRSPFFRDIRKSLHNFRPKSPVRINTSFHPECITVDKFCRRLEELRENGLWVDQIAMVDHPGSEFERYKEAFAKRGLNLSPQTFLGYWKGRLYPSSADSTVHNDVQEHGIKDLALYKDGFSCRKKQTMLCKNKRFLMAPDGRVYPCHSLLYSRSDHFCGSVINNDFKLEEGYFPCPEYGYCNPCDYPHVSFAPLKEKSLRNNTVSPKKLVKPCPICSTPMPKPVVADLLQCPTCGLFCKERIPSKKKIRNHLENMLLSACSDTAKEAQRLEEAKYQLRLLHKYMEPGRVYDVGAAGGFFLHAAQEQGWEVHGNEISRAAVKWAKEKYQLELESGFLEEQDLKENRFDSVVFWHSFEHVIHPRETLRICKKILKNDGVLMIAVPEKEGEFLATGYEPNHFYEFDRYNLDFLLTGMGFDRLELIERGREEEKQINVLYRCRKQTTESAQQGKNTV